MNVNASYKSYRGVLHSVNPPCLPFLCVFHPSTPLRLSLTIFIFRGVYLTDLTFVEEGNLDFIKNLINFGKRELVYNILEEIQRYQQTPYVFPLVDSISPHPLSPPFSNLSLIYFRSSSFPLHSLN
jgi:son of sevenless